MTASVNTFRVEGRVVSAEGHPLRNVRLAICDRDAIFDDLLGVGFTDERGWFAIEVTPREFNQEPFERERFPDLYIVCSTWLDDSLRAIHVAEFDGLVYDEGQADLGLIRIENWTDASPELEGVETTPGFSKRIRRLELTDPLVAHCLEAVAPSVERWTGWPDLLDGVSFQVVDDPGAVAMASLERDLQLDLLSEEGWVDRLAATAIEAAVGNFFLALYDPVDRSILINRSAAERQNLDQLKVVLGHELVHVGQFREHPDLHPSIVAAARAMLERIWPLVDRGVGFREIARIVDEDPVSDLMRHVEGFAKHIEQDYVAAHFPCATAFQSCGWAGRLFRTLIRRTGGLGIGAFFDNKSAQYTDGRRIYLDRRTDRAPAPFAPPGFDREADAAPVCSEEETP